MSFDSTAYEQHQIPTKFIPHKDPSSKCMQELKGHYVTAKTLATEASAVKEQVQALKAELEQRRLRRSAADIAAGGDGTVMTP